MASTALYDPAPRTIHVMDLARDTTARFHRISDHCFRVLLYGLIKSSITQTKVCEFKMAFRPYLEIYPLRRYASTAFLRPDGLAVTIRGEVYNSGDPSIGVSPLNGAGV